MNLNWGTILLSFQYNQLLRTERGKELNEELEREILRLVRTEKTD